MVQQSLIWGFRNQYLHATGARDQGDERPGVPGKQTADGAKGSHPDLGHGLTADMLRRQYEHSCAEAHDRGQLALAVPNPRVLGQNHPSLLSRLTKPFLVRCILGKKIVMHENAGTGLTQRIGHNVLSEATIDEEGDVRLP